MILIIGFREHQPILCSMERFRLRRTTTQCPSFERTFYYYTPGAYLNNTFDDIVRADVAVGLKCVI